MKKPSGVQTDGSMKSLVDVAAIDQLAGIVSQYDLSEIEISLGDLQVRLARERASSVVSVAASPQTTAAATHAVQGGAICSACNRLASSRPPRRREIPDGRNGLFACQSRSQAVRRAWVDGQGWRQVAVGRGDEDVQRHCCAGGPARS